MQAFKLRERLALPLEHGTKQEELIPAGESERAPDTSTSETTLSPAAYCAPSDCSPAGGPSPGFLLLMVGGARP